jgi:phage baseplate assembly protein W
MPTFIGFNTINQNKKFTSVDFDLIKIDLLNAFNIRQGELPGRPGYGTILWNYLFENQTTETQAAIVQEIQRVCGGDPRIYVSGIQIFPQDNGMLLQLGIAVVPSTSAQQLNIFFNGQARSAAYV